MSGSNERDAHAESTAVMRKDQLSELLDEEPEQLALTMPIAASQLQSLLADERLLPERPPHKFAPLVRSTSVRMAAVQPGVEVTIVPDDDDDDNDNAGANAAAGDAAPVAAVADLVEAVALPADDEVAAGDDDEAEATVIDKQVPAAEPELVTMTAQLDLKELTRLLGET